MRAYNLFRHRDKLHLLCAVPEDREVPRFIAERASIWGEDMARKIADRYGVNLEVLGQKAASDT